MTHTLPPLPYAYNALEPYISEEIMVLHHTKHHQTYVNALNAAEGAYATAATSKERIALQAALKFNGGGKPQTLVLVPCIYLIITSNLSGPSGHINHSLFWKNLAPAADQKKGHGGHLPAGELKAAIDRDFGCLDNLISEFNTATAGIQGSGWGWLVSHAARLHRPDSD